MDDSDRLSVLRRELRQRLGAERYELWLGGSTTLSLEGGSVHVRCASKAEMQWCKRKLGVVLAACAATVLGVAAEVVFDFSGQTQRTLDFTGAAGASSEPTPPAESATAPPPADAPRPPSSPPPVKRSRLGWDDFVIGEANRLAAQAAREMAQHPGRFTPLFLHGGPGTGKSHLLAAIADCTRRARSRVRVVQLTAEGFTTQFLEALDRRALPGFRQKMRNLDLLLIDDAQFFAGKKATLEELLYTIDALQARGGQVAIAADCDPVALAAVSPELASRVSAGLNARLEAPDYAMRLAIVRGMAERMQITLPDNVIALVARHVVGSGRLLSGAVNRLFAAGMAAGGVVDVPLAEAALADFCRQHAPQVRLADIQRVVCETFGVEAASLKSPRKSRTVAEPRMLAMWLARRYTRAALSEIGDFFGRRSHSTVVSAQKRFDKLLDARAQIVVGDRPCPVEEAIQRIDAKLRIA